MIKKMISALGKNGLENIIIFWGILDLVTFLHYAIVNLLHKRPPFLADFHRIIEMSKKYDIHAFIPTTLAVLSVILYISLIASGIFLIRKKVPGAFIVYAQTPLRILHPSTALVFAFFSVRMSEQSIIEILLPIMILIEIFKVATVIIWHRRVQAQVPKQFNSSGHPPT